MYQGQDDGEFQWSDIFPWLREEVPQPVLSSDKNLKYIAIGAVAFLVWKNFK